MRRRVAAVALCASLALQAGAEVAGQGDPAFAAAYDLWLSGDEAAAVPALATLAEAGNGAARLLIGVIDTTPGLQGEWLMALPRADRIGVLRAPGGISGQNWLRLAAGTDPIAAAWLQLWDGDATPEVILVFARLGETRAARLAGLALAARQKHGFDSVAEDPAYPAALLALAIRDRQLSASGPAVADLPAADPQTEVLDFVVKAPPEALAGWIAANPEGDPLVALCESLCPAEPAALCLPAALRAVGGYYGLARLGAPVEALTPSPEFSRSPMGIAVTLRQIAQEAEAYRRPGPALTGSACLDTALRN